MGTPPIDAARDAATKRIADKPSMVKDGDAIEELARAYERHAERLGEVLASLAGVGRHNFLGEVVEGQAATHNINVAVHTHPNSIAESLKRLINSANQRAEHLRSNSKAINTTEEENRSNVARAGW